jgi:hypothetical protein
MADEPENLILRMLREMRTEMRERDEKLSVELAAIKAETAHIPTIAEEVAALGVQVADIKESLDIIEHDLSGVKMRVEESSASADKD